MSIYKKQVVELAGPKEERIMDNQKNGFIASAKYFYNKKKQLVRAQYYLGGKFDGKRIYHYKGTGLYEETTFESSGKLVENIRYKVNQNGEILSYIVLKKNIKWEFIYKNKNLRLGKRYFKGKLSEYFVFKKGEKNYRLQNLFTEDNQKIGSVEYFYKNNRLIKRIKKDGIALRKAEYSYTKDGRLKEILLFQSDARGDYKIEKKRVFFYSLKVVGRSKTSLVSQ